MFDDELPSTFKKMHEFSTVDGFVEITESLAEMIKYLANEPSVGLFYVQQHTKSAIPNLVNLKNNVVEKSRHVALHTEDLEDSISTVGSIKECGFSIANDMIRDMNQSLAIISTKQPKRGLLQIGNSGYFSNVITSAKQKASSFNWPQLRQPEASTSLDAADELPVSSRAGDEITEEEEEEEPAHVDGVWPLVTSLENYDEFRADKEAKLEEWLGRN